MANGDPEVNHFRTVYFPEGETATKKASAKTLWSLYEADCNRLHAVDVFPCRGDCDAPQPHSIFIHMTQPPKILMLIPNRKMVIPNDHGAFYTQKRHDYVIIQHHLSFQYTTQPKYTTDGDLDVQPDTPLYTTAYTLQAIVNHQGDNYETSDTTRSCPHYYIDIRDPATGQWLTIDDSYTSPKQIARLAHLRARTIYLALYDMAS